VEMPGLLSPEALNAELGRASIALVSQAYGEGEFNVPSKLMNYLAAGLPVIASVERRSEAARIVEASASGWVSAPGKIGETASSALADAAGLRARSASGLAFAQSNLTPGALAEKFEALLLRGA